MTSDMAEMLIDSAEATPVQWRWTRRPWSSPRMRDDVGPQRAGFWMWLPLTIVLPFVSAALLASAVVEFHR
jgi:hypothetical protein